MRRSCVLALNVKGKLCEGWTIEGAMVPITGITLLCGGACAFYVRFLVALCKECRASRIFYLGRLEAKTNLHVLPEPGELATPLSRAA